MAIKREHLSLPMFFILSWGLNQGFDVYSDPFHPQDIQKVTDFGEAGYHLKIDQQSY